MIFRAFVNWAFISAGAFASGSDFASSTQTQAYGGDFHLETSEVRHDKLECELSLRALEKRSSRWTLVYPVPPETGSQKVSNFRLVVSGLDADWTQEQEKSPLARKVSIAAADKARGAGVPAEIKVTAVYDVSVLQRRLLQGKPPEPVANLSVKERKLFTSPTPTCDYSHPSVQKWIRTHNLNKGPEETELQFGFRVFCALQKLLRYEWPIEEPDFFNCSRTVRTARADCGASNLLFSGIMRNSGIPARVYCGRWLKTSGPPESNSHSVGEFFVAGVGWVPVDATAPADAAQDNMWKFGQDSGEYLATSMETDWELQLPRQGTQKRVWLHNYAVPDRTADFDRQESTRLLQTPGPIDSQ